MTAKKGSIHFDLLEVLKGETCPICRLMSRHVARYLDTISYEAVNDVQIRDRLRAALGFCPTHSWQWLELNNALATAIIYQDVLRELRRRLDALEPPDAGGLLNFGRRGKGRLDALTPAAACSACEVRDQAATRALDTFATLLAEVDFSDEYQRSRARLCLVHLRDVLTLISDAAIFRRLVSIERDILEFTEGQLGELIRKYDYRFRDEKVGDEAGAPARAVKRLAGMKGV